MVAAGHGVGHVAVADGGVEHCTRSTALSEGATVGTVKEESAVCGICLYPVSLALAEVVYVCYNQIQTLVTLRTSQATRSPG